MVLLSHDSASLVAEASVIRVLHCLSKHVLDSRVASAFGANSAEPASVFGEDSNPVASFVPKKW